MIKSILTVLLTVVLWGLPHRSFAVDMEDRFINPDFNTSKSIFIDVKDASLINVLKIISQQTGLSFIASHDVEDRKITLYLNKVPLNQALQMILDANGLAYQMQDDANVFVVVPKSITEKTKITRVYQLKYASVSDSKIFSTLGTGTSLTNNTSSSKSSGLEQVIKDSLSAEGKVVEDPRTNSLIVTDVPSQFDIIESTIAKLDVPTPQILIEVEMLDVSKSMADQLGITYGATPLSFTGGSKFANWPFGSGTGNSTTSSSSSSSSSSSTSNSNLTTGWNANGMTAVLNFLASQTDARTLARPRILTLNNETAQIEISTDQAISLTSTTIGTSGTLNTSTTTPERFTTGVILKVTPQANLLTREVTMAVSPKVIDVILSQVQPAGNDSSQIFDPETRGSDSILKLKDGQTMVIGGLLRNQDSKNIHKLPFLGDLPMIGAAFRSTTTSKNERELVIFLTPHIIDDPSQSPFKAESLSMSAQAALDIQDADDRVLQIDKSLNSYDMK